MINAATNLVRERLFAFAKVGFEVIFYLWLLESCAECRRWRTDHLDLTPTDGSLWNCYFADCLWFPPSLIWSVLANFRCPAPARCQVLSICLSKSPSRLKSRRGQARDEGGECGICLESLKTGRRLARSWPLSLGLPAARRWGHTEILTNSLRSTDNLILWHIINYDSLFVSIRVMTFQKRRSGMVKVE